MPVRPRQSTLHPAEVKRWKSEFRLWGGPKASARGWVESRCKRTRSERLSASTMEIGARIGRHLAKRKSQPCQGPHPAFQKMACTYDATRGSEIRVTALCPMPGSGWAALRHRSGPSFSSHGPFDVKRKVPTPLWSPEEPLCRVAPELVVGNVENIVVHGAEVARGFRLSCQKRYKLLSNRRCSARAVPELKLVSDWFCSLTNTPLLRVTAPPIQGAFAVRVLGGEGGRAACVEVSDPKCHRGSSQQGVC